MIDSPIDSPSGDLIIGNRLPIPSGTVALLWDMDGVLVDTLSLDYQIVGDLLKSHAPSHRGVTKEFIRAHFAYDPTEFWKLILGSESIELSQQQFDALMREYELLREESNPPLHLGVTEILRDAKQLQLSMAVVSNNPRDGVEKLLTHVGLAGFFDEIVGNDILGILKKGAPDQYIEACRRLNVEAKHCVVIEDSLLGAEAGWSAGCHTVTVATGANTLEELSSSKYTSLCLADLESYGK